MMVNSLLEFATAAENQAPLPLLVVQRNPCRPQEEHGERDMRAIWR
jgi:hypothetical protein